MAKFEPSKSANSNMIKNMREKATEQANARTVIDVDINLIDGNPDNSEIFHMDDVERLAHTIDAEGFYGTVEVYKKPDGRYQISSGHQRVAALRLLGWNKVPVIVTSMPDKETKVRKKLILANVISRAISPMELAKAIKYHKDTYIMEALEEKGITDFSGVDKVEDYVSLSQIYERVAEDFGKTSRTIRYLEELNYLIPELMELIESDKVSWVTLAKKAVPKMSAKIQLRISEELNGIIQVSHKEEGEITLTRKQTEECIIRVVEQVKMEEELAKLRALAPKSQTQTPSDEVKLREQMIHSLKVEDRPVEKAVTIMETDSLLEEDETPLCNTSPVINTPEREKVVAPPIMPKKSADGVLSAVASQLNGLLKLDFEFTNEAEVLRSITAIEEYVQTIKNKLL